MYWDGHWLNLNLVSNIAMQVGKETSTSCVSCPTYFLRNASDETDFRKFRINNISRSVALFAISTPYSI